MDDVTFDLIFIIPALIIYGLHILLKKDKPETIIDNDELKYPKSIIKEDSYCKNCPHNNPEECTWIPGWGCRG